MFPLAGISLLKGFEDQTPVPLGSEGEYGHTARVGINVRSCEPATQRLRGGSRPGLSRYIADPVVRGWIIQALEAVVNIVDEEVMVQLSQAGRVVTLIAVSQGNVYYVSAGGTEWTQATNETGDTPPLIYTGVIHTTVMNRAIWFADGVNWVYFDASDYTVKRWAATAGSLPVDTDGNRPRLICTWRGRMVMAGVLNDPQMWYMSRTSVPTDFNYFPEETSPDQPVAGNNSPLGLIGDVVTALIPYNDDILIVGGDHNIYMFNGDPMAGGQIDLLSDSMGIAWGQAWCKDPSGNLYFFSNRTGIYTMVPGSQPIRISQQVEQLLLDVDTGTNVIRMMWNDRFQGLHVFITPAISAQATTHLFWEQRTNAWWQDVFANKRHNPVASCVFDGNLTNDRVALIGSWDGYVRAFDHTAEDDDGSLIVSEVLIGPLVSKNLDELLLKDLQAVLGETSGDVTYEVFSGKTAEAALSRASVGSGTWGSGRNLLSLVRAAGHALYVRVTSTNRWSLETIRARFAGTGAVRRRGR